MQRQDVPGLDRVLEQLEKIISRTDDRMLASVRRDVQFGAGIIDADCTVTWPGGQAEVLIEYSESGSPGFIRKVASTLRSAREAFHGSQVQLVFAAPYITEAGMDVCRQEGLGCVDAAGNCLLSLPGAYVEIRGMRNPRPESRPIKSLFSPKSSRIVRVLLSNAATWWQVQELAAAADISIGLVSRLKQRLLDEGFVIVQDRRIRVRSPKTLIDAWTESYRFRQNETSEYFSFANPAVAEKEIAQWCEKNDVRYALGLFSAAARIAPHVRMNKAFVFVQCDPDSTADAVGLKPVASGANVVLLRPYDEGVFYGSTEHDGIRVASDIQTYIDLKTYKGRGGEAADFLMNNVLEKRWEQDQSMIVGR